MSEELDKYGKQTFCVITKNPERRFYIRADGLSCRDNGTLAFLKETGDGMLIDFGQNFIFAPGTWEMAYPVESEVDGDRNRIASSIDIGLSEPGGARYPLAWKCPHDRFICTDADCRFSGFHHKTHGPGHLCGDLDPCDDPGPLPSDRSR